MNEKNKHACLPNMNKNYSCETYVNSSFKKTERSGVRQGFNPTKNNSVFPIF